MQEQWTKWVPLENVSGKMCLEKLINNRDGTELVFKSEDESTTVKVLFEGSVLSFRSADEGRRLKTLNFLDEMYGTDFYTTWIFFIVKGSSYVQWFNEETYNIYNDYNIVHYVFLSSDDVVEVLSTYPPLVSLVI